MVNTSLPQIDAGEGNLRVISDAALQAILSANSRPWIFVNLNGKLAWVETEARGEPVVRELDPSRVKYILTRIARFFKNRDGQPVDSRPPKDLPADILARPDKFRFPPLRKIVPVPYYGPGGRLVCTPGYDHQTEIFYVPKAGLALVPITPCPTLDEVAMARRTLIDELLADFPFKGQSDVAHAVAAMLHPFVRPMIQGPTPIHLISKPTPGTGGTLLAQVLCYPSLGCLASTVTQPNDDAEWRRALLSWLRDGPMVLLVDNLVGELRSPALASAVTSDTFTDRIIGVSESLRVPVECLWLMTGNNPLLSYEMARRVIPIVLDAGIERPDLRRQFKHPDLRLWVATYRPWLIWASLTLVQAWVAAGSPAAGSPLGMFESWSSTLGGILQVAGIPGFLQNLDEMRDQSEFETPTLRQFVEAWWGRFADDTVGAAGLWEIAGVLDLGHGNEHSRRIKLGKVLDSLRNRRFGNVIVEKLKEYQGAQQYRLRRVLESGS